MKSSWFALVALVLVVGDARAADESLVGTFKLGGREGTRALSGEVTFEFDSEVLYFNGTLGTRGRVTLRGTREGDAWKFRPSGSPAGGITSVLPGATQPGAAAISYTLTLRASAKAGKFTGDVTDDAGNKRMTVELTRKRRALIAYASGYGASHDNTFISYGKQVRTYLRALGHEVDFVDCPSWDAVLAALNGAERSPYVRVVTIGHGGWDGPIFSSQISPWWGQDRWTSLVAAVKAGTAPECKWYASACHAAGSDRYERADGTLLGKSWVDEVGRATGRVVAGPAGITSTTLLLRQVRALEGAGTTAQETRVADGEGVRVVPRSGGSIVNAKRTAWADLVTPVAAAPGR